MLGCLTNYVSLSNRQGCTDVNVACENLVLGMMNIVYNYKLENYNIKKNIANAKGIDLIDKSEMLCVQVSSTHTQTKLKQTFKGINETNVLKGYHLKFFALVEKANNLRKQNSKDTDIFFFKGNEDVIDMNSFCTQIERLTSEQLRVLDCFIVNWLGCDYYNPDAFSYQMNSLNQMSYFEELDGYYPREISVAGKDDFSIEMYLNPEKYKRHTLVEFVNGDVNEWHKQYWLLIAAGQTGKTYEVKNLAFQLSKQEGILPVIFEAKYFKDKNDIFKFPFYCQSEHIVFIIDGIDEISSEELRDVFYDKINILMSNYPLLRIVLTCRRNYMDFSKFPAFQRLLLNDLSFSEIRNIVNKSDISSPEAFMKDIEKNNLYQIAGNPFFLKTMMKYYREFGEFQKNRLLLYKYLIDSSYTADTEKRKGKRILVQTDGDILLRKIALILQFTEQKSISETELKDEMRLDDSQIELCKRFSIFHCDEAHNYSFEINSFEMFYVANYLMNKDSNEILDYISYRKNAVHRIRPEWYDIFQLVLASMNNDDERRKYLLSWTFENDIEVLLNLDENSLDTDFKDRVFKAILTDYKAKQITSSLEMGLDFDRRLAVLCSSKDSIRYFLFEYKNAKELGPYLYLLSFIYWFIDADYINFNGQLDDYKYATYDYLNKFGKLEETEWYESLYMPFYNKIFETQEDIEKLINVSNVISDTELKICIFKLIEKTNLCDEFFDFALENEKYIHNYKRKGKDITHSVSRESVNYVFTHVYKYKNLKKLLIYIPKLMKEDWGYEEDKKQHDFRCNVFTLAESHIVRHPDIIDAIMNTWVVECNSDYIAYTPSGVFQDYRAFFERNNLCHGVEKFCEQLYDAFKSGKFTHDDFEKIRAKIILIITKKDVNRLAKQWSENDIYRCNLMAWLKNTPLQDVNATVMYWINVKFIQAKSPYDNQPSFEQMNLDRLALVFDRPQFKKTVNHIIEKFRPVNRKELRMKIQEDKEEHLNNYVMQYLSYFYDNQSETYNISEIKKSLSVRLIYYKFIVSVVQQNDKVKFTKFQMGIIEASLVFLIHVKNLGYDIIHVCLVQILKYNIELDRDVTIRLLSFAGVSYCVDSMSGKYQYFIDYALKRLGADMIKQYLPKLITQAPVNGSEKHTEKVAEMIVRLRITTLYPKICDKIRTCQYCEARLVEILLCDKTKGLDILKIQFDSFSSSVQLFIIEQLARQPNNKRWAMEKALKYRPTFTPDESRSVLLVLLRLGDVNALDECIEWLQKKDINSLCRPFMAPTLNYTDIKYLPKLLTLLRIIWDTKEPYSNWHSRVEGALTKMAEKNLEQFIVVNDAMKKFIEENNKYSSLNYFIGQLQKSDPRLKEASISVIEALEIIDRK
jgi:hypothetical protein